MSEDAQYSAEQHGRRGRAAGDIALHGNDGVRRRQPAVGAASRASARNCRCVLGESRYGYKLLAWRLPGLALTVAPEIRRSSARGIGNDTLKLHTSQHLVKCRLKVVKLRLRSDEDEEERGPVLPRNRHQPVFFFPRLSLFIRKRRR